MTKKRFALYFLINDRHSRPMTENDNNYNNYCHFKKNYLFNETTSSIVNSYKDNFCRQISQHNNGLSVYFTINGVIKCTVMGRKT